MKQEKPVNHKSIPNNTSNIQKSASAMYHHIKPGAGFGLGHTIVKKCQDHFIYSKGPFKILNVILSPLSAKEHKRDS